ncbi:MAG: hypothetical protein JST22_16420 [Bacteroidetes bacterium]|nr:hypothetical protein [Bacteroidota bacterium]
MEFTGSFETHITIVGDNAATLDAARRFADMHGMKFVHIVLDRGALMSQPMLTRRGRGTLSDQLLVAGQLAGKLRGAGVTVIRVKIEAAPLNIGVPLTEDEALRLGPERYFEHHVKLLLPADADPALLCEVAQLRSAHLSRNVFKRMADGCVERFVTQRCHGVRREDARRRLTDLTQAIEPFGYPVLEVEEEYVVYDSDAAVDYGWII